MDSTFWLTLGCTTPLIFLRVCFRVPYLAIGLLVAFTDRGKGVPSFDEMMDIALVEVDFDDPTTNVRGRRALAIAKPTPRGY